MDQAETQLKAKRLTEPVGNNAEVTYRQLLKLDANNAQAQAGLTRIAQDYLQQAKQRQSAEAFQESLNLIEKGLAVVPNQVELTRLQKEVRDQWAAEQQRQTQLQKNDAQQKAQQRKLEQQRQEQQRKEQQRQDQQRQEEKQRQEQQRKEQQQRQEEKQRQEQQIRAEQQRLEQQPQEQQRQERKPAPTPPPEPAKPRVFGTF